MMASNLRTLRRQLRVVALLAGARRAGTTPVGISQLHVLAYFADALSPVWDLRIVDPQLLKRAGGPFSPALQADVDGLVGLGVIEATGIEHVQDPDFGWRLQAAYRLNWKFASRILDKARSFEGWNREVRFVEEVVLAFSTLDQNRLLAAVAEDASYGDIEVSAGRLLDIARHDEHPNLTARVALKFRHLLQPQVDLLAPEMVHLYVRELDRRMSDAA
jgi:hypothetical protein